MYRTEVEKEVQECNIVQ